MIDVSVVIVTWNSEGFIRECLSSIYDNTRRCRFEVIVVDNGSTDRTVAIIRDEFPKAVLIQTGVNMGFSPANNYALGLARGKYVFLLNPDTYFRMDVLGELFDFMESHPDAACSGPRMVERNGRLNRFQIRQLPSVSGTFFSQFGLRKMFPDSRLFAREVIPDFNRMEIRVVPFIGGAAMMFRRSVFDDIGQLDEQIPMYFEDIDICARIIAAGKRSYFVHTAEVVHLGAMSSNSSPARPILYEMENGQALWLYFMRYRGKFQAAAFTAIILVSSLLRVSVFMPVYFLTRLASPAASARMKNRLTRSRALASWSLSNKEKFSRRISGIFGKKPDAIPHALESSRSDTGIPGGVYNLN